MNFRIIIPLLMIVYISTNIILTIFDIKICETNGCELSKEIISIPYLYVNYLGLAFAFILFVLGYIKSNFFNFFSLMGLLSETIFIGMLFFVANTTCLFCMGFYLLLILNFILNKYTNKLYLLYPIMILITLSFFKYDNMNISKINLPENGKYLIQSETCKHCKEIKEFFKETNIEYKKLEVEESMALMNTLNLTTIPILIEKTEEGLIILDNKEKIKNYINKRIAPATTNIFTKMTTNNNLLIQNNKEEGCSIFSKKEEDCD